MFDKWSSEPGRCQEGDKRAKSVRAQHQHRAGRAVLAIRDRIMLFGMKMIQRTARLFEQPDAARTL
jgi:hypothetical protein